MKDTRRWNLNCAQHFFLSKTHLRSASGRFQAPHSVNWFYYRSAWKRAPGGGGFTFLHSCLFSEIPHRLYIYNFLVTFNSDSNQIYAYIYTWNCVLYFPKRYNVFSFPPAIKMKHSTIYSRERLTVFWVMKQLFKSTSHPPSAGIRNEYILN